MQSRFSYGDIVLFQPNVEKIDFRTGSTFDPLSATRAKVVGISFTQDKVLYDLALFAEGGFYEIYPIKQVDSVFVCPLHVEKKTIQKSAKEAHAEVPKPPSASELYEELKKLKPKTSPFDPNPPQPTWVIDPPAGGYPPGTIICMHEYPLMNGNGNDNKH